MIQNETSKRDLRPIKVSRTATEKNLLYLLVAQIASKVTGEEAIEVDPDGTPLCNCTDDQRREIQAMYDSYEPKFIKVLHDYFAVFVRRNNLYNTEPRLLKAG